MLPPDLYMIFWAVTDIPECHVQNQKPIYRCCSFFIEHSVCNVKVAVLFQVTFNYDGKTNIFENLDISAVMDSRIAVVGENGSGKTTLLKILLGELDPIKGIRHTHRYCSLVSD